MDGATDWPVVAKALRDGSMTEANLLREFGFFHRCRCCEQPVRLQCETDYCGSRCRRGKCGHRP